MNNLCIKNNFELYKGLTKNNKLKIECFNYKFNNVNNIKNIAINSNKKYWFNCDMCCHNFNIRISHVNQGKWCSYCSNHRLCSSIKCKICFNKSFASTDKNKLKCWHKIKNKPRDVFKNSGIKYWFKCNICNHDFMIGLNRIRNNRWCPYCSCRKICDNLKCISCFNRSFASFNKFTKNNNLKISCWNKIKPKEIFKKSNIKYWFKCDVCNHDFQMGLNHVNEGKWCQYCSSKKMCNDIKCKHCFNNSFASFNGFTKNNNLKISCWHETKNKNCPRKTHRSSGFKYWFKCDVCNHDFQVGLNHVNEGKWCQYCSSKKMCNGVKCKHCFNKSFASFNDVSKIKCWHKIKNKEGPREVFKSSGFKYWFKCNICNNDFKISLNHVNEGKWCLFCKNKTPILICYKTRHIVIIHYS